MTPPVPPQGNRMLRRIRRVPATAADSAAQREADLEGYRTNLVRQTGIAKGMYTGGHKEHVARIKANQEAIDRVDEQLKKLRSGQGRMRQRQATLGDLLDEASR